MRHKKTFLTPMQTSLAIALLLLTACGSCIIGSSRSSTTEATSADSAPVEKKETAPESGPTPIASEPDSNKSPSLVREDLIKALEALVGQPNQVEGFGLFSEGGFSGAGSGQYMYLVDKDGHWLKWHNGGNPQPPSLGAFAKATDQLAKSFVPLVDKFDQLADTNANAFDAFSYTYVHLKKTGDQVSRSKVLTVRNLLSDRPEAAPYNELVGSFRANRNK